MSRRSAMRRKFGGQIYGQKHRLRAKLRPKNGTREELYQKQCIVKTLRLDQAMLRPCDVHETTEKLGEYRLGSAARKNYRGWPDGG